MTSEQTASGSSARRRFIWTQRLIVAAIVAAGTAAALLQDQRLWRLDALVADAFQRVAPRAYDPALPVRIVSIDSESLRQFGQWPWPRTYFAELTQRLGDLGVAAIAFDVVFAEPDRTSPEVGAATARRFGGGASKAPPLTETAHDRLFGEAIRDLPVAIAAVPGGGGDSTTPLERKYGLVLGGGDPRPSMSVAAGLDRPLPVFVANASGYGLGGVDISEGGAVRRLPLFRVVGGEIAPALAMEALRIAQQAGGYVLRSSDASGEAGGGAEPVLVDAKNGALVFPLAPDGGAWIRFAGAQPARFLPAWKVLTGDLSDPLLRAAVEGQIVFVAATAPGLGRPVETPLGFAQPAEVQAELLEQAFLDISLQRPDWARPAEALVLAALGLLTAFATFRLSALAGAVVAALGCGGVIVGAWLAFDRAGLVLAPLTPAATVLAVFVTATFLNYVRTRRETGAVRSQFERFVAPAVIQQLIESPERHAAMRGEQRDLAVMFCDARGFTTLSENMPPEELIFYLNTCFTQLTDGVLSHGGTVDKYMGDCVMAFWNAPLPDADYVAHSLGAMFDMREAAVQLTADFSERGLPAVDFGFGVNAGVCNIGLMGSPKRLEYSCVGDTVNVASRLEGLTKSYGVWNLVTEAVAEAAPGFISAPLGFTDVRGRNVQVGIRTMLGRPGATLSPELEAIRLALEAVNAAQPSERPEALDALRTLKAKGVDGERLAAALA